MIEHQPKKKQKKNLHWTSLKHHQILNHSITKNMEATLQVFQNTYGN